MGDATLYKGKSGTSMKIEHGPLQKDYVNHLCIQIFPDWTWFPEPSHYIGIDKRTNKKRESYYFYTFKHEAWNFQWEVFMTTGKKTYQKGSITKYQCPIGFCYWFFDDGSLDSTGYMKQHTEGFCYNDQLLISEELNQKFGLETKVIHRGKNYYLIYIPKRNSHIIKRFMQQVPRLMPYKVPNRNEAKRNSFTV